MKNPRPPRVYLDTRNVLTYDDGTEDGAWLKAETDGRSVWFDSYAEMALDAPAVRALAAKLNEWAGRMEVEPNGKK